MIAATQLIVALKAKQLDTFDATTQKELSRIVMTRDEEIAALKAETKALRRMLKEQE